jgi:hypothetical protein
MGNIVPAAYRKVVTDILKQTKNSSFSVPEPWATVNAKIIPNISSNGNERVACYLDKCLSCSGNYMAK